MLGCGPPSGTELHSLPGNRRYMAVPPTRGLRIALISPGQSLHPQFTRTPVLENRSPGFANVAEQRWPHAPETEAP